MCLSQQTWCVYVWPGEASIDGYMLPIVLPQTCLSVVALIHLGMPANTKQNILHNVTYKYLCLQYFL